MKWRSVAGVLVTGVLAALPAAAHATPTSCSGTIANTTISGGVVVPPGSNCILKGDTVTGGISISTDAGLSLEGGNLITGSIIGASAPRAFDSFAPQNTIRGSLTLIGTTGVPTFEGDFENFLDALSISGATTISGSSPSAPWVDGNPNTFGSLSLLSNRAFIDLSATNTTVTSMTALGNTGGGSIVNQTIGGSFTCSNTPRFVTANNTVRGFDGGASGSC